MSLMQCKNSKIQNEINASPTLLRNIMAEYEAPSTSGFREKD